MTALGSRPYCHPIDKTSVPCQIIKSAFHRLSHSPVVTPISIRLKSDARSCATMTSPDPRSLSRIRIPRIEETTVIPKDGRIGVCREPRQGVYIHIFWQQHPILDSYTVFSTTSAKNNRQDDWTTYFHMYHSIIHQKVWTIEDCLGPEFTSKTSSDA